MTVPGMTGVCPRLRSPGMWPEVHVKDHVFVIGACRHLPRVADQEGHAQGLFVHEPLVVVAVVSEEEPLG